MFVKLKKIIDKRISRLGNREKIEVGFIEKIWTAIIDSLLSETGENFILIEQLKKSNPCRLQDGVLTIEVQNQAISSELSLLGFELMDSINKKAGRRVVKRLFFKMKRNK